MIFAYENDAIYFADELSYESEGNCDASYKLCYENLQFWHPHDGMLIHVATNNQRIIDIIRYYIDVPTQLNFKTLREFYNEVCEALDDLGYSPEEECYDFYITIANSKEAYEITGRGVITMDNKKYALSGMLSNFCLGYCAEMPRDWSAKKKITEYYDKMDKNLIYRSQKIVIVNTKDDNIEIL